MNALAMGLVRLDRSVRAGVACDGRRLPVVEPGELRVQLGRKMEGGMHALAEQAEHGQQARPEAGPAMAGD
jgi:hypothetical protein